MFILRYSILTIILVCVHSARILSILPENSVSHQSVGTSLLFALAERGHQVTIITTMIPETTPPNVTIIEVNLDGFGTDAIDLFEFQSSGLLKRIMYINIVDLIWTEKLLQHVNVQKLLSSNQHFDLVLIDILGNFAQKGFCYHYNAICTTLNVYGATSLLDAQMGNPNNPSYIPDRFLSHTTTMNFCERLYNVFVALIRNLNLCYVSLPKHNALMQKYFPGAPDLSELNYNVSLSLVNSHFANSVVVANLPNVVEIGGIHIQPPKQLPDNIKQYLDNATNGVIYFNMGSILKSKNMKKENLNSILRAFSQVKQNILWKFEDETVKMPTNVKTVKWISQTDVLAHPNIRIFITHGGLLSMTEAIYFSVPIVGIPIFADQKLNVRLAEESGFGVSVSYESLNEKALSDAINLILNNSSFSSVAKQKSKIFHDQLTKPLDRAVYWVEYCLRHRGAHHLRSPALSLKWYQYLLLDIFFAVFVGVTLCLFIIVIVFKKLIRRKSKIKNE